MRISIEGVDEEEEGSIVEIHTRNYTLRISESPRDANCLNISANGLGGTIYMLGTDEFGAISLAPISHRWQSSVRTRKEPALRLAAEAGS